MLLLLIEDELKKKRRDKIRATVAQMMAKNTASGKKPLMLSLAERPEVNQREENSPVHFTSFGELRCPIGPRIR